MKEAADVHSDKMQTHRSEAAKLHQEKQELKEELKSANEKIENLSSDLQSLQRENFKITKLHDEYKQKVIVLEAENQNAIIENDKIVTRNIAMESRISKLEEKKKKEELAGITYKPRCVCSC